MHPFCYLLGISVMEISINDNTKLIPAIKKIIKSIISNALTIGIILGFSFNILKINIPEYLIDALAASCKGRHPYSTFFIRWDFNTIQR